MNEMSNNWHIKLFKKSVLKQNKLKAIRKFLELRNDDRCLDIGGDNGVISYYLRKLGGSWASADLEDEAVASIEELVKTDVCKIDGLKTPFQDNTFNIVLIIDFLEHIPTDKEFTEELSRIIKDNGILIINVPHIKRFSMLRAVRGRFGLSAEEHGHLREGYTIRQLKDLLGDKFTIFKYRTYSRFFTELVDTLISGAYKRFGRGEGNKITKKGVIVTQKGLSAKARVFKVYSVIYPVVWLVSKLDLLLFFTRGYSLIVKAMKN